MSLSSKVVPKTNWVAWFPVVEFTAVNASSCPSALKNVCTVTLTSAEAPQLAPELELLELEDEEEELLELLELPVTQFSTCFTWRTIASNVEHVSMPLGFVVRVTFPAESN